MSSPNSTVVPKVTLGRTGIVSTKLGLGTAGWPRRVPFEQTVEMLQAAFEAGIRHIDTAPLYHTEEIIGQAFQEIDVPSDVVLATKAGSYSDIELGIHYNGYRARHIYRSVERSLKRFGVDYLDIVHIHDVRVNQLDEVFAEQGALAALLDLKDQGVIGAVGMGTLGLEPLQAAVDSGDVDVLQIFHTYTLLNQSAADELIPSAVEKGISILNSAPYAGYILATGPGPDARYNYAPASDDVIEAARRLEVVCAEKGVDLPTAALAFSLRNPDIDVTVPASGKTKRIPQWIAAMNVALTDKDWDEILAAAGGQYELRH
ncbi:MAG: aldo/keto reductase [Anaerolineae bacterium]